MQRHHRGQFTVHTARAVKKNEIFVFLAFSRWREGHQNCTALVKGIQYSSSNNGHEQDLEKYVHGGDSHAEG